MSGLGLEMLKIYYSNLGPSVRVRVRDFQREFNIPKQTYSLVRGRKISQTKSWHIKIIFFNLGRRVRVRVRDVEKE